MLFELIFCIIICVEIMKKVLFKDQDIRSVLNQKLENKYKDADTIIINELGLLQGLCRIDVAVINGIIHGYEIKSEADTLDRLPMQAEYYNKVMDKLTLVCSESHFDNAINIIPDWWGIKIVTRNKQNNIKLYTYRKEYQNKNIEPMSIVELLWKNEVSDLLLSKGFPNSIIYKNKSALYELCVNECSLRELKDLVRFKLKTRTNWRDPQQLLLNVD